MLMLWSKSITIETREYLVCYISQIYILHMWLISKCILDIIKTQHRCILKTNINYELCLLLYTLIFSELEN